jgi:DNA helicase HerA-like ATPase
MSYDIDPTKQKVREICKRLKPILGSKIDRFWKLYSFSDDNQRKDLETYLELLNAKTIKEEISRENIILVPPSQEEAYGEYYIGDVVYNNKVLYPFGFREHEWTQHIAILGRSGAGKTNTGFWVLKALFEHGKNLVVFDWKRNYRDLLAVPGFEELKVYTVGRCDLSPLRFNPLIPPENVAPDIWLKLLIEIISHAYFLGEGVAYILMQAIQSVYREKKIYEGSTDYPTFRDVLRWLKTYDPKGREINWLSSTIRAVAGLCFAQMDEIVNIDNNIGLEKLMQERSVLELDSLIVSDRIFIIETLLLWIYQRKLSTPIRERFDLALIMEEAHQILGVQKRSLSGGETIIETIFRQCREINISITVLDQQPAQLSPYCMANTYGTIVTNLKHRKDVDMVNRSILLDEKEKEYPIRLSLGQAIVKLQDRIQNAFLIRIPEFPIKKGLITDEFLKRKYAQPAVSYALSLKEKSFLQDIKDFPDAKIVERYERLGFGAREGTEIKEFLLSKGLIEQKDLFTSTGRIKQLSLTELGMSELARDEENTS